MAAGCGDADNASGAGSNGAGGGAPAGGSGGGGNRADADDRGLRHVTYTPKKLKEGTPHPDHVVETEVLAAVSPPDLYGSDGKMLDDAQHHLADVVAKKTISNLQLETVCYSNLRFTGRLGYNNGPRPGFFLGDGAGVGKGRQIAATVLEHWRRGGRRTLWMSVSNDLKWDARRDLSDLDVGAEKEISIHPRGPTLPQGKLSDNGVGDGVVFMTFNLLIASSKDGRTRLDQIVEWLNEDPTGMPLIVLDECHRAKNLMDTRSLERQLRQEQDARERANDQEILDEVNANGVVAPPARAKRGRGFPDPAATSSKTAIAVMQLQEQLPDAKVLYASATGASEAKQLRYMTRLGCFDYDSTSDFIDAIEGKGMSAMELYACGMKASGAYLCRALSYNGAEFDLLEVDVAPDVRQQYDAASEFMMLVRAISMHIGAEYSFEQDDAGGERTFPNAGKAKKKTQMGGGVYWGAHQRLFRSLLMCAKVPALAEVAKKGVADGSHVVIGLQSTGEAGIERAVKEAMDEGKELTEMVSAPLAIISQLIKAHFPTAVTAADVGNPKLDTLLHQVHQAVCSWEKMVKRRGGADGTDGDANSDDEVEIAQVKDVHAIEAEKLEKARRTGQLIDLDDDVSPEQLAAAAEERRREADDERERQRAAAAAADAAAAKQKADEEADEELPPWKIAMMELRREANSGAAERSVRQANAAATQAVTNVSNVSDSDQSAGDGSDDGVRGESSALAGSPTGSPGPDVKPLVGSKRQREAASGSADPRSLNSGSDSDSDIDLIDDPFAKGAAIPKSAKKDAKPDVGRRSSTPGKAKAKSKKARRTSDSSHGTRDGDDDSESDDDEEDEDASLASLGLVRDERLVEMKALLLRGVEALQLPPNPLDDLIDRLGGAEDVAEMTGRKQRMVRTENGTFAAVPRCPKGQEGGLKMLNLHEREKFMRGEKVVAIISEAASSGISLHADRRFESSSRRRLHLTLELPWSAQQAIQQFGRSHRSNQTSAPVYRLVVTPCGGERRFASSAASRLQKMGAMLKGDRRAMGAGVELQHFDVDNDYGAAAVESVLDDVCRGTMERTGVTAPEPPKDTAHSPAGTTFFEFARRALMSCEIVKGAMSQSMLTGQTLYTPSDNMLNNKGRAVAIFLNRLLGLPIAEQDALYSFFSSQFDAVVERRRADGTLARGVQTIEGRSVTVNKPFPLLLHTNNFGGAQTYLTKVEYDRGMTFESAKRLLEMHNAAAEGRGLPTDMNGFWLTHSRWGVEKKPKVLLALEIPATYIGQRNRKYRRSTPAMVASADDHSVNILDDRHLRNTRAASEASLAKAEELWNYWFEESGTEYKRSFPNWLGRNKALGMHPPSPLRLQEEYLITGAVLPLFRRIEQTILSVADYSRDDDDLAVAPRALRSTRRGDDDMDWIVADDDGNMHGYGQVAQTQPQDRDDADGSRNKERRNGLKLKLAVTTDTRQRINGIFIPTKALQQIAALVDDLGGLPGVAEEALEEVLGPGKNLWSLIGIKSPAQYAKEQAEERARKEAERLKREAALKAQDAAAAAAYAAAAHAVTIAKDEHDEDIDM